MGYFFLGGVLLLVALAVYQFLRGVRRRVLLKGLRWITGIGAAAIAVLMVLVRRFEIASIFGFAAYSILARGRIGPYSFENANEFGPDNVSRVRSRYFTMTLDHDTGVVQGDVVSGHFAGADLIDLGEAETRALIAEVAHDADSLALLESWLDANRGGWREYFDQTDGGPQAGGGPHAGPEEPPRRVDPVAEAHEVLGLKPGATPEEIRAAHRELMKAVHPDHGGSSFLASKINEARDLLLERHRRAGD